MVTTLGRATLSQPITVSDAGCNSLSNLLRFFNNPLSNYLNCNNLLFNCLSYNSSIISYIGYNSNVVSCFNCDSGFNSSSFRGSNFLNDSGNLFYSSSNIFISKRSKGILILLQHKQTKQRHVKCLITIQKSKCLNAYRNYKGIADSAFIPSFGLPQRVGD